MVVSITSAAFHNKTNFLQEHIPSLLWRHTAHSWLWLTEISTNNSRPSYNGDEKLHWNETQIVLGCLLQNTRHSVWKEPGLPYNGSRQTDVDVRHVSYSHWLLRTLKQRVIFMKLPSTTTTAVIVWNIMKIYVMPQH